MDETSHIILGIPEDCPIEDNYNCPVCEYTFNQDEWEYNYAGDAWGGSANYLCPECDKYSVTLLV